MGKRGRPWENVISRMPSQEESSVAGEGKLKSEVFCYRTTINKTDKNVEGSARAVIKTPKLEVQRDRITNSMTCGPRSDTRRHVRWGSYTRSNKSESACAGRGPLPPELRFCFPLVQVATA